MKCIKPFYKRLIVAGWSAFPCGQCVVCKINKSREWTFRMIAESGYWQDSAFLTLTYSDEEQISLNKTHLQTFFKNLRKRDLKFKYYAAGEYGEENFRPHYHVCLFFNGKLDFTSDLSYGDGNGHLAGWTHGVVNYGSFTKDSARYVADYLLKSIGQEVPPFLHGPFRLVSKGMGELYFDDNKASIEKHGVFLNGSNLALPRYFADRVDESVKIRHTILARMETERLEKLGRYPTLSKMIQAEKNIVAKQGHRKEFLNG